MRNLGAEGTKYDVTGNLVQVGPFNDCDLDENGDFVVDKFFKRLRQKHRVWRIARSWRPEWMKEVTK